jgi:LPS-assembly protein
MFKKLVFICLVALCSVNAQELTTEKFQVVANKVDTKGEDLIANGNVVIFSPSYYISAQKVIYNKKNETFELFDDVVIVKNNNIQAQSDYAFFDTKAETLYQKPTLLFENSNNLWINSENSEKKDNEISLESSIISSCDCEDPAWSIKVSSADYDTEDKWLHTFNTRLYIKSIPVLYTPYFGFSTDKTRRTGLLIPTIGYGSKEGLYYSQPIYIAPAPNYDIELTPQIRTKRGEGLYTYFRYVDSQYSKLEAKAGIFKEKGDYYKLNDLDDKHFGWDLTYTRTKLFSNENTQDGLYADLHWLNDVEYNNLEDDKYRSSIEKKVESKINYFYNTSEYYTGAYFRYYIDTTKDSNSDTLQELPQVQFHTYSKPILLDKLLYSTDSRVTYYTREDKINATKYEFSLPLSYSYSLFDDYLQLNLKNETVLNHYKYSNTDTKLEDGTFIENITTVGVGSDLIKPYKDYLHTVNLSANYVSANTLTKDGDLYSVTNNNLELTPFPISQTKKSLVFAINQSLYDRENLKQIVNHKLKQSILYNELDEAKFQNMENEIIYNYILGTVSNKLVYNHQDKKLTENSSYFTLKYNDFDMRLDYYKSVKTENSGKDDNESYKISANYKLSHEYKIGYYESYNLEDKIRSKQGFIFTIYDRCWDLDLKLEKEVVASSNANPRRQDILYIQVLFKPLGGLKQSYKVKDSSKK